MGLLPLVEQGTTWAVASGLQASDRGRPSTVYVAPTRVAETQVPDGDGDLSRQDASLPCNRSTAQHTTFFNQLCGSVEQCSCHHGWDLYKRCSRLVSHTTKETDVVLVVWETNPLHLL
jgi:hypothetical protein